MNFRCFKTKFEANKSTQENAFIIYLTFLDLKICEGLKICGGLKICKGLKLPACYGLIYLP